MYDNILQSGPTVKRRSFEHRHKASSQHRNSKDGRKLPSALTRSARGMITQMSLLQTERIVPPSSSS